MGVEPATEGNRKLRREHGKRNRPKVGKRLLSKAHAPERAAKIAAAKRGKARPAHVVEALRQAATGRKLSKASRDKMNAAAKANGTRPPWLNPPWNAEDDALLATLPAAEVAKRTGRTLGAVYMRQSQLKLPDGRRRS